MMLRWGAAAAVVITVLSVGCRAESSEVARAEGGIGQPASSARSDVEYLTPFGVPTRPFSPAVRVGDLIFLSGQIGTDAGATGNNVVPGGIEPETRQTLDNIKRTLEAVGSGMDKVVKCTVMMADMREWERMNAVYRTYFPDGKLPARSALGANGLALDARVEIECIATR
jgi:reactive intermediate/imine deaminase